MKKQDAGILAALFTVYAVQVISKAGLVLLLLWAVGVVNVSNASNTSVAKGASDIFVAAQDVPFIFDKIVSATTAANKQINILNRRMLKNKKLDELDRRILRMQEKRNLRVSVQGVITASNDHATQGLIARFGTEERARAAISEAIEMKQKQLDEELDSYDANSDAIFLYRSEIDQLIDIQGEFENGLAREIGR